MDFTTQTTNSVLLFKGGPTLIDLLIDSTELNIIVTGPRMLFDRLELVTTLSAFDGYTAQSLNELASNLEAEIYCGLVGVQHAAIEVEPQRSGAVLQVNLGPPTIYQSELTLRTRTGESFKTLIRRVFSIKSEQSFFVGLHPVTATGHLEHHLVQAEGQEASDPNHSDDTGGHHGHS